MTAPILILLVVGLGIGVVSGLTGIGGGVLIVPALTFLFGLTQKQAIGTSLAMLMMPVGVFAVIRYHQHGNVDWRSAILIGAGFAAGAWIGGWMVNDLKLSDKLLRMLFAILLIYVAARVLFQSDSRTRAAVNTAGLFVVFAVTAVVLRLLGRKLGNAPYWPRVYQDRARQTIEHDYEI